MKHFSILLATLFFIPVPFLNGQSDYSNSLEYRIKSQVERKTAEIERKINQYSHRFHNFKINFDLEGDASTGAFLGIESERISKEKAKKLGFDNPSGSYVSKVLGNTSAEKANIQAFDYIFGIDEFRTSLEENLSTLLNKFEPGDEVTVHFVRKGEVRKVTLVLGERADAERISIARADKAFLGIEKRSIQADDLIGVRVNVVHNSTAEAVGLRNGDLLKSINGHPIIDWNDITIAINSLHSGDKIAVVFERDGKESRGEQTIKSFAESHSKKPNRQYQNWGFSKENYAFLGINAHHISTKKAKILGFGNPFGSYVTGVLKNTAAEKSGIQVFDYIYGIEEYRVGERQRLTDILHHYKPGDQAPVLLIRKGENMSLDVTFGKRSDAVAEKKIAKCDEAFFGIINSASSAIPEAEGVPVSIVNNSTAEALGLKNGARIKSINGFKMVDWTDIGAAINNLKTGETITVVYEQNGKTSTGSMPIKSYGETKNLKPEDCDQNRDSKVFSFEFDDEDQDEVESEVRIYISEIKVTLENVTKPDATDLKNMGVEIEADNNLPIEKLNLYPNPSKGMFTLKFNLPNKGTTQIKIFNDRGRIIYDYDLGEFTGDFSDEVDISQNGTGFYFLKIQQGNRASAKKIVLSKN